MLGPAAFPDLRPPLSCLTSVHIPTLTVSVAETRHFERCMHVDSAGLGLRTANCEPERNERSYPEDDHGQFPGQDKRAAEGPGPRAREPRATTRRLACWLNHPKGDWGACT
jgi:hypothetical protein